MFAQVVGAPGTFMRQPALPIKQQHDFNGTLATATLATATFGRRLWIARLARGRELAVSTKWRNRGLQS